MIPISSYLRSSFSVGERRWYETTRQSRRKKRKTKIQWTLSLSFWYQRAGTVSSSWVSLRPTNSLARFRVSLFTFAFIRTLSSVFTDGKVKPSVNAENAEQRLRRRNRSVENRWAVESLNHGVVQWLQGRRKPRVGCAGQNCTGPFFDWNLLSCATRTPFRRSPLLRSPFRVASRNTILADRYDERAERRITRPRNPD